MEKQATSSLPSSSSKRSLSSEPHLEIKEVSVGIETHEEIQRGVPEFGGKATSGQERTQNSAEEENKRQESRIVLNAPEGDSQSFNCCDGLRPNVGSIDKIYENFTSFPVAGAIILDETHERCLLVKGCKGPSWSFPCGKKCKDEEDHACAIRKVLEEIGCDISYQLNKKEYLELTKDDQRVRLYIVAGVSEDRPFEPLTKGEISEITWYPLDHLGGLELFMMAPFIPHLKKWIVNNPSPLARRPDQSLKELCVWSAKLGGKRTTTVESYTRELDIKFGSLTFDQFRAVAKGRLVMKSNNTKKPEVETTTSGSSSRKPEVGTTTSYKDNITFGSLKFVLSTI